jgi:hypothetical protein
MKSIVLFVSGVFLGFVLLSNQNIVDDIVDVILNKIADKDSNYGNYNPVNDERFSLSEREYFKEIALKSEYSTNNIGKPCRWVSDMNIYVDGEPTEELISELNQITLELNDLINPIDIRVVENRSDANFIIYIGKEEGYLKIEPDSRELTNKNWGLFTIYGGTEIYKGNMFVDTYRCKSLEGQKHLLREELTQSLGLRNDSYRYEKSIFQQRWTETTEYAPIDRQLIRMLYNYK